MKIMAWVCAVALAGMTMAGEPGKPAVQKILFLGNSITLHGPNKNIGWDGNWGMAASSADKDYVHLVTTALASKDGSAPETMVRNIASFERQYGTFDAAALVKETSAFNADLIVVAIGENVPALTNAACKAEFATKTAALLTGIKGAGHPLIVVRSCFWANGPKDEALKKACQEIGGTYLDIGALGKDEKNFARSEREFKHKGVANHPGDKGMKAIADAIVAAVRQAKGIAP
jgi:hypothetical protein